MAHLQRLQSDEQALDTEIKALQGDEEAPAAQSGAGGDGKQRDKRGGAPKQSEETRERRRVKLEGLRALLNIVRFGGACMSFLAAGGRGAHAASY